MAINSKSTKAEILEALAKVQHDKDSLQQQVNQLKKQGIAETKPQKNPEKIQEKSPIQESETKIMTQTTLAQDISQVIKGLQTLQVNFGGAVSSLSDRLITEASALSKIQQSIAEEIEALKELHELEEINDNTLDELIQSYESNTKEFEQAYGEEKETLEQELANLVKTWQKEQENHLREIKERNDNYRQTKEREEQEYKYNLQLSRDLEEEEYQQQQKLLYKQLEEIKEAQETIWKEREENIAQREKEYGEAKTKVEQFEEQLAAKVKQGKEEGRGIGAYQAKIRSDLRQKEIEGEKQNYQFRLQSLQQTINNNEIRLASLSQQLDTVLKQVQDLAVKAIEGTSNRNSYDAMREIALEQAKNQPKSK